MDSKNPIDHLKAEHDLILQFSSIFLHIVQNAETGAPIDLPTTRWMIHFLDFFVDHLHHTKEENILFKEAEKHGLMRNNGPIACMLHEHKTGRAYVKELFNLSNNPIDTPETRQHFIHLARGYLGLMGEHIYKENHILYPAIQQMLSPEEMANIQLRFECLNASELGQGRLDEIKLMLSLIEKQFYAVQPTQSKEIL
ncbi:hemerythrin domain-containing protein [bacterium]|nr:hemerythrin domain-containing protein [bacterium]